MTTMSLTQSRSPRPRPQNLPAATAPGRRGNSAQTAMKPRPKPTVRVKRWYLSEQGLKIDFVQMDRDLAYLRPYHYRAEIQDDGRTFYYPMKPLLAVEGVDMKRRAEVWRVWQQCGLPLPDTETGRVNWGERHK